MKEFTSRERTRVLTGVLFMSTLIMLYILLTQGLEQFNLYRVFFPVYWGIFVFVFVLSEVFYKLHPVRPYEMLMYSREREFANANFVSLVMIVLCFCLIEVFQVSIDGIENILKLLSYIIVVLLVAYTVLATKFPSNTSMFWYNNSKGMPRYGDPGWGINSGDPTEDFEDKTDEEMETEFGSTSNEKESKKDSEGDK